MSVDMWVGFATRQLSVLIPLLALVLFGKRVASAKRGSFGDVSKTVR